MIMIYEYVGMGRHGEVGCNPIQGFSRKYSFLSLSLSSILKICMYIFKTNI